MNWCRHWVRVRHEVPVGRPVEPSQHADGSECYLHVSCQVDNIMVVHHDAIPILRRIDKFVKPKETPNGDPDVYLGAKLGQFTMPEDVECRGITPSKYVQEVTRNCEICLKECLSDDHELVCNAPNPFALDCEPSMDASSMLDLSVSSHCLTTNGF